MEWRPRAVLAFGFFDSNGPVDRMSPGLGRPDPRWPSMLRKEVAKDVETPPTLDQMRRSGKVHGDWPAEALRRYEQERLEYLEDVRAFWELFDEFEDIISLGLRRGVLLVNSGDAPATNVEVRLTFPPGVVAETDDSSPSVPREPAPPLPLAAPAGERRQRFERRFGASAWERSVTAEEPEVQDRLARCTAYMTGPGGSTVLIYRVARVEPAAQRESLYPVLAPRFASWDRVAPFEIAYEVVADDAEPLRGTLRVEPRVLPPELSGHDVVGTVFQQYDQALGGLLGAALGGDLGRTMRGTVDRVLNETRRFVEAVEREPTERRPAPPAPSPPPPPAAAPPPVTAGTAVYRLTAEGEEGEVRCTVVVSPVSMGDEPAWRVAVETGGDAMPVQEVAVLREADLQPLTLDVTMFFAQFVARVQDGLVMGGMAIGGAEDAGAVRLPLPPPSTACFLSEYPLLAALPAWPLAPGWERDLAVLGRRHGGKDLHFSRERLRVTGEERVTVPAGTFDCWVVERSGTAGDIAVHDRYLVRRGRGAGERVVVAARQSSAGKRSYRLELTRFTPAAAPAAAPDEPVPAPPRPPLSLWANDAYLTDGRYVLSRWRRPAAGEERTTVGSIESLVRQTLAEHPTVEQLRASGRAEWAPAAALLRYALEREEFADDLRAYWELDDQFQDRVRRTVPLGLELNNTSAAQATGVYVRLTFPAGLIVESDATAPRNPHQPAPPLPLTAPLDQARKRFPRRFRLSWRDDPAEQHHSMGARPPGWAQLTLPDGSTVITYGPRTAAEGRHYLDSLAVVFPTWEAVAPFTITYEITSDWTAPARGELRVNASWDGTERVG